MKPKIKICGMTNAEDVAAVAQLAPDAMGFIFWEPSARYVSPETVARFDVPSTILKVGVFVDAPEETMLDIVEQASLDVIQLHGNPDHARKVGSLPTWQAIHLDRIDFDKALATPTEAVLLDQGSATQPGGTGKTIDWAKAAAFVQQSSRPVWLAGGLTPVNVTRAIQEVRPYGVDAVTGLEKEPGKKDLAKVESFIQACRETK